MTISVNCPNCGRQFSKIKPELAGKKVRCACGEFLRLPEVEQGGATKELVRKTSKPSELHYSDLDQILAKPENSDFDFDPKAPRQESKTSPMVAFPEEPASEPTISLVPPARPTNGSKVPQVINGLDSARPEHLHGGTWRKGFLFLLALAASFIAFGFAMFLLSARLASENLVWQGAPDETMRQIYAGQLGRDATASWLKLGFQLLGWTLAGAAVVLMILGSLQMVVGGIQLYTSLRALRWVDGLMATIATIMLFLLIGTLFLHGSHSLNLNRQINQATVLVDGDEPANIQRLREQLKADTNAFRWTIASISAAPATIFGCSMLRLFSRI